MKGFDLGQLSPEDLENWTRVARSRPFGLAGSWQAAAQMRPFAKPVVVLHSAGGSFGAVALRRYAGSTAWVPCAFSRALRSASWNLDKTALAGEDVESLLANVVEGMSRSEVLMLPLVPEGSPEGLALARLASWTGVAVRPADVEMRLPRCSRYPYFGDVTGHRARRLRSVEKRAELVTVKNIFGASAEDLRNIWPQLMEVEENGWKGRSPYSPLRSSRTYMSLLQAGAELGVLSLSLSTFEGRPIAFLVGFLSGGEYAAFHSAYSDSAKTLAPSVHLYLRVFKDLPDEIERFSFLRGTEAYKRGFGPTPVALNDYYVSRSSWAAERAAKLDVLACQMNANARRAASPILKASARASGKRRER